MLDTRLKAPPLGCPCKFSDLPPHLTKWVHYLLTDPLVRSVDGLYFQVHVAVPLLNELWTVIGEMPDAPALPADCGLKGLTDWGDPTAVAQVLKRIRSWATENLPAAKPPTPKPAAGPSAKRPRMGAPTKAEKRVEDVMREMLLENPLRVDLSAEEWTKELRSKLGRKVTKPAILKTKTWEEIKGARALREAERLNRQRGAGK